MHRTMTIDEIVEYLNSDGTGDDFAFRGDSFVPVRSFRPSRYHGDDGPEYRLPGVSAIYIPAYSREYVEAAIKRARQYGGYVFLIRGEQRNADAINHDPAECLIVGNRIVCVVA